MCGKYAYISYDLFSVGIGQSVPATDPWVVGTFALPTNWLAVVFSSDTAVDLPGCPGVPGMAQKPQFVGSHRCGWFVFSFFICLDSWGRNSAGVWCQQRLSTLAQRPAVHRKDVLVGLTTLPAWIPDFLETSPKVKTLPNHWVRVTSSR